jgi:hypothetical protein
MDFAYLQLIISSFHRNNFQAWSNSSAAPIWNLSNFNNFRMNRKHSLNLYTMCGQYEGKTMSPVYLVEVVNPKLTFLAWTSEFLHFFPPTSSQTGRGSFFPNKKYGRKKDIGE